MADSERREGLLSALLLLQLSLSAAAVSVIVSNGFEFHAAMTSPQVSWILVADNMSGFGVGSSWYCSSNRQHSS